MTDAIDILYGDSGAGSADAEPAAGADAADILYPDTVQDRPKVEAKPDATDKSGDDQEGEDDADADGDTGDVLDGLDVDESFEAADQLRDVATELGLDKAGVERLAEVELNHRREYWDRQSDDWRSASMAEFDSDDFDAANAVIKQYGDADLVKVLTRYSLGNHPAVIRFVSRIARSRRG